MGRELLSHFGSVFSFARCFSGSFFNAPLQPTQQMKTFRPATSTVYRPGSGPPIELRSNPVTGQIFCSAASFKSSGDSLPPSSIVCDVSVAWSMYSTHSLLVPMLRNTRRPDLDSIGALRRSETIRRSRLVVRL